MATTFSLRLPESEIVSYAERYRIPQAERDLIAAAQEVRTLGKLSKELLESVARWKSPRRAGDVDKNADQYVQEVSAFALAAIDERARIQSLTILDGISWPTASVILHLFHQEPYPILDFRVLWSLSTEKPSQYTFEFWWSYVEYCRSLARRTRLDMRTLDRGLWQYSKDPPTP